MSAPGLTTRQRDALVAIEASYSRYGKPARPAFLAERLDTSVHGACRTMASLVRRGLVERVYADGCVSYRRTKPATHKKVGS